MSVLAPALFLTLTAAASAAPLPQGDVSTPIVTAARAAAPIRIDGRLDEDVWTRAVPAPAFVQRDPDEGRPPAGATDLRLAFDDDALYVGARLHDADPDAIVRRLSRRDLEADADSFAIFLDPHHDHLTGVEFRVSAAGVQLDAIIYNDVFRDVAWDAVWESAVRVDADGWVVEARIPFSQLRFPRLDVHTWGINAERVVHRLNESSWLAMVPKAETGLASRMGHLEGLSAIDQPRHLELLPYTTARSEFIAPAGPGDPFNDGSRLFGGAGLDLKYGLATNLTLDAAVNPDFGQVEVDPAVVNLTAFETFFEEKRPFFIEGSRIFTNFGQNGAARDWAFFRPDRLLFYSRRVGRAPQGGTPAEYVDRPAATTILGAAKLTGRTAGGWTLGLVNAVTEEETAKLVAAGTASRTVIEPLSNYAVARAERELGRRGGIGMLATAVHRRLDGTGLADKLVGQAYTGGVDGYLFLDNRRDWVVYGSLAGSYLSGEAPAIERLQRASARYYQRPDATHVRLDPTRTSLSGWTGTATVNRNAGNVRASAGLWAISPGFEANDLGFSPQTDRGGAHALVHWLKQTPDRFTRTRDLWVAKWWTFNLGGDSQGDGVQGGTSLLFPSYWRLAAVLGWSKDTLDDKLTRGGATTVRPGIRSIAVSVQSDTRRRVVWNGGFNRSARNFGSRSQTVGSQLQVKPTSSIVVSFGPSVFTTDTAAQYVQTQTDATAAETFGLRSVFARLDQTEVAMTTRVNVVLSPKLSLQVYMQPLLSAGAYTDIKELAAPRTFAFTRYGIDAGTSVYDPASRTYRIDPDGAGPASPFPVGDPDFNFRSLRTNAVFRWEYRPGSSLYVVWTQLRQQTVADGRFDFGADFRSLGSAPADDVLLVKVAYWLGR